MSRPGQIINRSGHHVISQMSRLGHFSFCAHGSPSNVVPQPPLVIMVSDVDGLLDDVLTQRFSLKFYISFNRQTGEL